MVHSYWSEVVGILILLQLIEYKILLLIPLDVHAQ